jgi:VIT1/CCC1 family predicted Fe2+/Mn2+ transporter
MTSIAQADDFELFTRIRGQFTLTRLSTGVYDCPADFSEMTLCVYSREAFKPPQCNGHSLTAKEASRMLRHLERHRTEQIGWLRAAVLGANDGILSTASLVLGVAAAHGTLSNVLVAGVAGLVAGAMSMAAGEYVSVHSQADTE